MRVGQVKTAERVQGADKLLQLQVDIGDEVLQIVAGLALSVISRKILLVAKSWWLPTYSRGNCAVSNPTE